MNGFLAVIPGGEKEPQSSRAEGRATGLGQLKGELIRENHNFGLKHNHTGHPIPCGSINEIATVTAALAACGFWFVPRKEPRTPQSEVRASC